jgi:hypothetical protein
MALLHPYASAPDTAFWSRSVSRNWRADQIVRSEGLLITRSDKVISAGSCFASNIVPHLEAAGFTYLRTEARHPAFLDVEPEALGYDKFSAAYGNIYTTRQMLQLLLRALGRFSPAEDRWIDRDEIVDPLRPGLRYRARSQLEFDLLTRQHLQRTLDAFQGGDVFVFTLGLTEAWVSAVDGTVFPACPGTVAGQFDPARHTFENFSTADVLADLVRLVDLIAEINPAMRIILTVSPVPLVATATPDHVVSASTYSKSVLRAAAGEVLALREQVTYFPSYEIITGSQAPADFFEPDRRNVSEAGVRAVMDALLTHCEGGGLPDALAGRSTEADARSERASSMSRLLATAECEEAMADTATIQTSSLASGF